MKFHTPSSPLPPIVVRNTILLATSQALLLLVGQAVFILGPLMTFVMSGSTAVAGVASGLIWGGRVLVVYQSGRLMDRLGRRHVLVIGTAVAGAGTLMMAIAIARNSLVETLLALLVYGIGSGAAQQARVAVADMYPPRRRGEGIGYLMTGNVAGAIAATLYTAALVLVASTIGFDPNILMLTIGAVILFASTYLILSVRPDPQEIAERIREYFPDEDFHSSPPSVSSVAPLSVVVLAPVMAGFVASALAQGDMTMMMSLVSLVLNQHDVPLTLISLAVSAHIVGMFAPSLPFGKLSDKAGRKWTIATGGAVLGLGAFLTPATGHYEIITVAIVLVGVGWSAVNVASTAMISDLSPVNARGRILGLNDMVIALTAISVPVAGGTVIGALGFQAFAMFGLLLAMPIMLAVIPLRESRPGKFIAKVRSGEP